MMATLTVSSWNESDIMNDPHRRARRRAVVASLSVAALCLMACGDDGGQNNDADTSPANNVEGGDTSPENDAEGDDPAPENNTVVEAPPGCEGIGTPGATARCLSPTQTPEYYVAEANAYFDTLDIDADRESIPNYSELVARWEWPPWLLLTGFERETMISTGDVLRDIDPSTVPIRDCRFFDTQPFARCYVVFEYEGGMCPIYEEFTFNDQGEMTFIEAWSDLPGFRPMPDREGDMWAERPDIPRLSTRVPGLGNETGLIDIDGAEMMAASMNDPEVADFAMRAADQWRFWAEALREADPDFFAIGCGWPIEGE